MPVDHDHITLLEGWVLNRTEGGGRIEADGRLLDRAGGSQPEQAHGLIIGPAGQPPGREQGAGEGAVGLHVQGAGLQHFAHHIHRDRVGREGGGGDSEQFGFAEVLGAGNRDRVAVVEEWVGDGPAAGEHLEKVELISAHGGSRAAAGALHGEAAKIAVGGETSGPLDRIEEGGRAAGLNHGARGASRAAAAELV